MNTVPGCAPPPPSDLAPIPERIKTKGACKTLDTSADTRLALTALVFLLGGILAGCLAIAKGWF